MSIKDIKDLVLNRFTRSRKDPITTIVLHSTDGKSATSSVEWLKHIGFSYHYIIERNGDWSKLCAVERVAYHAAALALPPVTFTENDFGTRGVQASGAGGNAQYIAKDQPAFLAAPGYIAGEEFIFSAIVEVTQNNPTTPVTTTHNHVVRIDWEDAGGSSGRRVSLLNGPQSTIPKTRLSVLFSPPTAAQMPALTITKGQFQCGQQSVSPGLLTWRVGDVRCFPVYGTLI